MGHKTAKTARNISNVLGPETADERIVQWQFKKFFKEDESLEDELSGWPTEADSDQLRGLLKLILFQLHEKLPKNSVSAILWWFGS